MNSTIDIENKLLELDKELHLILSILRKRIELNDCLIAASAFSAGIDTIITGNIKHFVKNRQIKALTPDEI